ncbi:hypothetical protein C1T31_13000 [Hanstruepera neustonica]|uniref:WbqC family protein n=1 Tax=Hanstruepera neustonica TaxID=1445657 RepID=A0A2K1DW18_9FLAO|nr:WbqC family protein [Hanstruepera neustonica]PNQ72236.1 hypothetical protein C1T31_13000 [Hanstruepera neustonica]
MSDILIHPTYFPNIAHFSAMVQADTVTFEWDDNFQKQTYRNRCYVYGANGKLSLNIPVIHTQKKRQKYRTVKIQNSEKWQRNHWKSLESAYRTSPYFEFYEDELKFLFETPVDNLYDFNLTCIETICDCLQIDLKTDKSVTYEKTSTTETDFRFLVNAKQETTMPFDNYIQVFADKHGFIGNLSILDLLFNEGPNSINYLESQNIPI